MRTLIALLFLIAPLGAADLIPKPRNIDKTQGEFLVDARTTIIASTEHADHAQVLSKAIQKTTGFLHRVRTPKQVGMMRVKQTIRLDIKPAKHPGFYRMEITHDGTTITGGDRAGLMHGVQTFANLLPASRNPGQRALIPAQTIEDWPETARRIFHLDVGAHLFPLADLKSLIDWLSFHKLNELHLQLNNDHGWRMESLKFPKLHEIGSVRASTPPYGDSTGSDSTEYGGYYTQNNLRELAAYAKSRAVTVIPSFSFTTGASALIASYPELGKTPVKVSNTWGNQQIGVIENAKTSTFLDTLLAEVATIFPAKEIRLEGPVTALHKELKKRLAGHKRELFIPTDLATTDLSVYPRPKDAELLLASMLEAEEGFNPASKVYLLKPTPTGAQATLRTRYVHNFDKLQYLAFPRLTAFAEITWLPPALTKYEDFRTRLEKFDPRYRTNKVKASIAYDPPLAKTLHDTRVSSTLKGRQGHSPAQIFDGKADTFFWTLEGLATGDHLTLEFPWPVTGTMTIATGKTGTTDNILEGGLLELSEDGKNWHTSEPLILGLASINITTTTRFARLRATSPQKTSLILSEIELSEPLLSPLHEENREITLPVIRDSITLTFNADFREHPQLRDEVNAARRIFFEQWLPLATKIGVSHHPEVPKTFEVKSGEPGELSPQVLHQWMLKRMIPALQSYPNTAPLWFSNGFTSLLLADLPQNPDKSKYRSGGPETAAFLQWVANKYGFQTLTSISQKCRRGGYNESAWKYQTKLSLAELADHYQRGL